MGESTMEPVSAWLTEPRHGGLPKAHIPNVLPTSLTKLRRPVLSPTKIFFDVESKIGPVRMAVAFTVSGHPPAVTSAGVPRNTPVNLWSTPLSSPAYRTSDA